MVNAPEAHRTQYVSTGRGGAANFRQNTNLAESKAVAGTINAQGDDSDCALTRMVTQASLGIRFATGRGGAGNILPTGETPLPSSTTPMESRPRTIIRTGRGGLGNLKETSSGRSASFSGASKSQRLDYPRAKTDQPHWAQRVPRIDAAMDEGDGTRSAGSFSSDRSEPMNMTMFGRIKRRLSSFGSVIE